LSAVYIADFPIKSWRGMGKVRRARAKGRKRKRRKQLKWLVFLQLTSPIFGPPPTVKGEKKSRKRGGKKWGGRREGDCRNPFHPTCLLNHHATDHYRTKIEGGEKSRNKVGMHKREEERKGGLIYLRHYSSNHHTTLFVFSVCCKGRHSKGVKGTKKEERKGG